MSLAYWNGSILPKEKVVLSPDDRGFLFADGIYEVVRTYGLRAFAMDEHLDRLQYGLDVLAIRNVDVSELRTVVEELIERNATGDGELGVYIQVTRGVAPRSHPFPSPPVTPTVYAATFEIGHRFDPEAGVQAITYPDLRWLRCDVKSIALLPNCLAAQKAVESGAFEAVLVRDGMLLEGAHTSFFAVVGGVVRTAPLNNYILHGITRKLVLELCAAHEIAFEERPVSVDELGRVEEIFLAGTTTEVLPVVKLDGREIGEGKPGSVTRKIRSLFMTLTGTGRATLQGERPY